MIKIAEEARTRVAAIDLTAADQKSFETFQPLADQMKAFAESGGIVTVTDSDIRNINEKDYTELVLSPEKEDGKAKAVKFILAFNNRNIYVGEESLREIGEKDIDAATAAIAAFKVDTVEMTGTYPMRKSKAAEDLGYVPSKKELTPAEWSTLGVAYRASDEAKGKAEADVYGVLPSHEIPKVTISPVE